MNGSTKALEVLVQAMEAHLDKNGAGVEFWLWQNPQFFGCNAMDAQAALTEVCRRRKLNARFSLAGIKFEPC